MRPRLGVVIAIVALLAGVPAALGGSTRAAANSATFNDSIGEDPAAPDITSINVSNDDAGLITFQVNISNRPALTQDMLMVMFLDTDQNENTGDPDTGAEYAIQLVPGAVELFKWNGSDYVSADSQSSVTYAYPSTGPVVHVSAVDLGRTRAFDFDAIVLSGIAVDATGNLDFTNAHRDAAPDPGHGFYSYQVLTKLVLSVTAFTTAPKPAKAGRSFAVSLSANENDTAGPVQSGTVACTASLAGKRLAAVTHTVANGVATCVWRIPKTAKGRIMRGSITLTVRGTQVTRPFTAKIS
jgi:hypothetical protein